MSKATKACRRRTERADPFVTSGDDRAGRIASDQRLIAENATRLAMAIRRRQELVRTATPSVVVEPDSMLAEK